MAERLGVPPGDRGDSVRTGNTLAVVVASSMCVHVYVLVPVAGVFCCIGGGPLWDGQRGGGRESGGD